MIGNLILKDGSEYVGKSFGKEKPMAGEVVFATGMVGYPESLTDPSYAGQILVLTYPLQGNYGVPEKKYWESGKIQVSGLVVSSYIDTPSHHSSKQTLSDWLKKQNIPALEIKDTREITQKLRTHGVMLGKMEFNNVSLRASASERSNLSQEKIASSTFAKASAYLRSAGQNPLLRQGFGGQGGLAMTEFKDPNLENLAAKVSTKKVYRAGSGKKTVVVIDCGLKQNIVRELVKRNVKVVVVPWDYNLKKLKFDAALISNGPGDPKQATTTIENVKYLLAKKIPTFGICLGNQILALAADGDTYKLKYGHRGQNQPCVLQGTNKCYLTTQNHGFAIKKIPKGFKQWFYNANDKTNEGIIHNKLPFMSVQFHPEAHPGPLDTGWLFDEFLKKI
ncbi:MAG: glutamine-hydrolyzing carbamoyl-phosphate synthase small subunit [Patescibacteria group bacterium]|nr:glutamine-hydrolyzing carbamoyl-phosphate synthase small subunit [Patescibacteria group bacterium]